MQIHDFPEDLFYSNNRIYNKSILEGKELAQKLNIHICGLARDCEQAMMINILRIERLRKYFKASSVFIVENDSSDRTPKLIKTWENKSTGVSASITQSNRIRHQQDKSRHRMIDMAYYRNILLDNIPQCDIVLMYDFDIIGGFSYDGIFNSLTLDYDVIAANSILFKDDGHVYYDTFAFRHPSITNEAIAKINLKRGDDPLKVNSAFGGLAIYKSACFYPSLSYDDYDCEHVTLHNQLLDDDKSICVNPNLITLYNTTRYSELI